LGRQRTVKGNEFLKKLRKLAKERGIAFEWHPNLGKGSHGILKFGDKKTVLRNVKDELKTGTFHAMLKQLGLSEKDL
jgi:mRNA interferase HicA